MSFDYFIIYGSKYLGYVNEQYEQPIEPLEVKDDVDPQFGQTKPVLTGIIFLLSFCLFCFFNIKF